MDKSVLVYEGDKGLHLMVKCDGETVWLTQAQMCQLFDRDVSVISPTFQEKRENSSIA